MTELMTLLDALQIVQEQCQDIHVIIIQETYHYVILYAETFIEPLLNNVTMEIIPMEKDVFQIVQEL